MKSSDAHLWQGLIAGDHGSLAGLYRAHAPDLLRYGKRLADEASVADALHTLFVRLWERHDRLPADAVPRAYLLIALRNELLKGLRADQRIDDWDDAHAGQEVSIEESIVAAEGDLDQDARMQAAMATLSARERELVELRFLQELDYTRIAEVTGISYQSARNVLARALAKLRERLSTIIFLSLGTKAASATLLLERISAWLP